MKGSEIISRLRSGKRVYGTLTVSTSPMWPDVVKSLGVDFVFIDTEHTPIDRDKLSWMCKAYRNMNIAPIVRIPSPDPYWATMALDGGACGLIAPYVESVDQVKELVGAVKHKPVKGKYLKEHLVSSNSFGNTLSNYVDDINKENVLIINIESREGIRSLPEILKVKELDGVLIGPHDLSCSLGIPENYQSQEFIQAVDTIITKVRDSGKGAGIHMIYEDIESEINWLKKGANILLHGADLISFKVHMSDAIDKLKKAAGDQVMDNTSENINI
ncbi:aldolase/citrate lyase family protein [Arenibacter sp. S6351L]|uniref:HpcH/HpaI aldolase family protein n=1 Tax=Arenibacter sp. S6351L TaxID=2926407 RepID=UPI001FF30C8F|nr:aldolase/citrate lyase family protein [Arenibacter sp. S6351L]MCK0135697.1 aldolase/citrate lyase family protein [Arenibacter sp. S6351L]